jgi:hypothetical protein
MMNRGMEILLERMKTHPDEFNGNGRDSKWENLVYRYADHLDEEDKQAFKAGIKSMRQDEFTAHVMEELLAPTQEDEDSLGKFFTKPTGVMLGQPQPTYSTLSTTSTGRVTIPSGNLTIGKETLDESTIQHIKAHVEAMQEAEKRKPYKTLFGKLFNYL